MEINKREELIKDLYMNMKGSELPSEKEKNYYFDESTGTWYSLTGKTKIERPTMESALNYFKNALTVYKTKKRSKDSFQIACYCSIAIECISKILEAKNES